MADLQGLITSRDRKFVVVYVIDGLGLGGAERLMIPILKNLDKEVFEPRVCVLQNKGGNPIAEDLRAMGIPVDLLSVQRLRDITAMPRLYTYLRHVDADLVHTQLEFSDVLGNVVAKLLKLPSVSTIHTMPSQEMGKKLKLHQSVEMFSLRHFCDTVISVSEEARQYHLKISHCQPQKTRTIYNGVDLSSFANLSNDVNTVAVRSEFSIPADATVFITVAVLRELKGIQFMIRAFPSVLATNPNSYYLIVGSGDYRETLEWEVEQAGVGNHVFFSGKRNDIPRLLVAANIFILPTLTEALPTVLAEAMAARLPIIACAVGGVPEMVMDGKNGRLVPPADTQALANECIALSADPQYCKVMGETGWQFVNQKFDARTQVEQLKNLYLELIKSYER